MPLAAIVTDDLMHPCFEPSVMYGKKHTDGVHTRLSLVQVRHLCRLIDRVQLKGSRKPVDIYTYDVPFGSERNMPHASQEPEDFFAAFPPTTTPEYRQQFEAAVRYYLGGADGKRADWPVAQSLLLNCLTKRPKDPPALTLLSMMRQAQANGEDPPVWQGYTRLSEK